MSDVTEWITTVASCIGVVGAIGALLVSAKTLRRQTDDHHRQQASAVAVGAEQLEESPGEWHCFVKNHSPLPIYDVKLKANTTVPEGEYGQGFNKCQPVMAPTGCMGDNLPVYGEKPPKVEVTFMDSACNLWQRCGDGQLKELERYSS